MGSKELVLVLGGPGSGKGTQSASIARDFGIGYVSSGDTLRHYTAPGVVLDEDGNPTEEYAEYPDWCESVRQLRDGMRAGGLVQDSFVMDLVERTIEELPEERVFMDGYPRKQEQVDEMERRQWNVKAVLFLEVPDVILTGRLLKRGETSGRSDDNADSIKERLVTYHEQTQPVVDFYEGGSVPLLRVDGVGSIEEVRGRILEALHGIWEDITPPAKGLGFTAVGNQLANAFSEQPESGVIEETVIDEYQDEPQEGADDYQGGSQEEAPRPESPKREPTQSQVPPPEGQKGKSPRAEKEKDDGEPHYNENGELTERSRRRVLNDMIKECLAKKKLLWGDDMLENFIGWMEKELTDCVEAEKYQEAKRPYAALTWALAEKQGREKEKSKQQTIGEPRQVRSLDEDLAEYDDTSERKRRELIDEQGKYLAELDREWREWRPETYRRPSPGLREMRRNLAGLIALGRFDEAAAQKSRAEQMEKQELEEAQRRLEGDYQVAKSNLVRKQMRDREELERKRALGRQLLIARRGEQQRLAENRLLVIESKKSTSASRARTSHGVVGGERVLRRIAQQKPQGPSKLPRLKPPTGEAPVDENDDGRPKAQGVVYRAF